MSAINNPSGVQVQLPVREDNKEKWDTLGVKWTGSFEGNPFLVRAELPSGWSLREGAATDFDKRSFTILDSDGAPKATVNMKTAAWDKWANVSLISSKAAAEMKIAPASKLDQDKFDSLLSSYNSAVRTTHGMGSRGQLYIDAAYTNLEAFVKIHPEFRSDLPKKHQCYDDGVWGSSGAMMALAANLKNPESDKKTE